MYETIENELSNVYNILANLCDSISQLAPQQSAGAVSSGPDIAGAVSSPDTTTSWTDVANACRARAAQIQSEK